MSKILGSQGITAVLVLINMGIAFVLGWQYNKHITNFDQIYQIPVYQQVMEKEPTVKTLEKEYFSIEIPKEWIEKAAQNGVEMMAVNLGEKITNEEAKKINFRTYLAMIYYNLDGMTEQNFIDNFKKSAIKSTQDIKFQSEEKLESNGNSLSMFEVSLSQKGVSYKSLIGIVFAKESKDVWVLTFNTLSENWDNNKEQLKSIMNSFKIKKVKS